MRVDKIEIFKEIPWYEWKYQVSNIWRVKSLITWKILKKTNNHWYYSCSLWRIHRLVAKTFIINYDNKSQVNHKDWNKQNNNVDNLEWATPSENILHSFRIWLSKITNNHHFIKKHPLKWKKWILSCYSKKVNQYDLNNNLLKKWNSFNDIWRDLNFHIWNIIEVCQWKRKTAYKFIWKYNID